MCAYIQTNADKVLIDQFEASLHQLVDGELSLPIKEAFEDCQIRFEMNRDFRNHVFIRS